MVKLKETINKKEHEFTKKIIATNSLDSLINKCELDYRPTRLSTLTDLQEKLNSCFIANLFMDDEFLAINICSHFYTEDNSHIFGLELLATDKPCAHCGDIVTHWYGIKINAKSISIGYFNCNNFELVNDSSYVGEPVLEIKELILNRYPYLINSSIHLL